MKTAKRVGDVVVLPITSFSPGVGQMGAEDYESPMAFVKHEFEGMLSFVLVAPLYTGPFPGVPLVMQHTDLKFRNLENRK